DMIVEDGAAAATPCAALVREGVERASDDRAAARTLLTHATEVCQGESSAWRELAGVNVLDADWAAAASHAARAVTLDSHDELAWRILATARYLRHDDRGALAAWNRAGEPVVGLIDVKGLQHTRYDVIADAIGVPLKTVLTPDGLALAERRV